MPIFRRILDPNPHSLPPSTQCTSGLWLHNENINSSSILLFISTRNHSPVLGDFINWDSAALVTACEFSHRSYEYLHQLTSCNILTIFLQYEISTKGKTSMANKGNVVRTAVSLRRCVFLWIINHSADFIPPVQVQHSPWHIVIGIVNISPVF